MAEPIIVIYVKCKAPLIIQPDRWKAAKEVLICSSIQDAAPLCYLLGKGVGNCCPLASCPDAAHGMKGAQSHAPGKDKPGIFIILQHPLM